jgi:hypothetical protein
MIDPNQPLNAAPLWTVGTPRQTTVSDPQRGFVPGWEIPVILVDKSSFTVTVTADGLNPDNVLSVIEDHISRLLAVRALTGPTA